MNRMMSVAQTSTGDPKMPSIVMASCCAVEERSAGRIALNCLLRDVVLAAVLRCASIAKYP